MTIQLVIFDLAGTTVHDPGAVNHCILEALRAAGLDADPAEVDAVMGLPKPEALRLLIGKAPAGSEALGRLDAIHADFVARMLAYYRTDPSVVEVEGISRIFADLQKSGVRVGLNTGFSREITRAILDRLGWGRDALVDTSVSSDEVPRGRPSPDMIHHLMEELGIRDASAVAKVGDAPADLQEGTNAGCGLVVGVTWGSHTRAQLEGHPHTHLVDAVEELSALLVGD
jgi:phosphonatase-like hydrolase